ncbi:hypothetical protein D3C85_1806400 [compost metagenome]
MITKSKTGFTPGVVVTSTKISSALLQVISSVTLIVTLSKLIYGFTGTVTTAVPVQLFSSYTFTT